MIKMTYMSDGKKVELNFDTVEELEKFNEGRMEKLEEQLKEAEDRLEAAKPEIYEEFAKAFLKAKKAGFDPDQLFDLLSDVLQDLADEKVILNEDGSGLLYAGTLAQDEETESESETKDDHCCKGCGRCAK